LAAGRDIHGGSACSESRSSRVEEPASTCADIKKYTEKLGKTTRDRPDGTTVLGAVSSMPTGRWLLKLRTASRAPSALAAQGAAGQNYWCGRIFDNETGLYLIKNKAIAALRSVALVERYKDYAGSASSGLTYYYNGPFL